MRNADQALAAAVQMAGHVVTLPGLADVKRVEEGVRAAMVVATAAAAVDAEEGEIDFPTLSHQELMDVFACA